MIRWQRNLTRGALALALVVGLGGPALAKSGDSRETRQAPEGAVPGRTGWSRVIVTLKPGADALPKSKVSAASWDVDSG